MRYPQWNYTTVQSFVFTSAILSEVHLLKHKKKKNEKMNKAEQLVKGIFKHLSHASNSAFLKSELVSRYSYIFMLTEAQ